MSMIEEPKEEHLEKIHRSLITVGNKLNLLGIPWLLGGSGVLMVHGLDIVPWDLDILATPENVNKIIREFGESITNPDEEELTLNIEGIDIEIIKIPNIGSPVLVLFQNTPIPVNTLENELSYYKKRQGKEETIKLIEKKLSAKTNQPLK